VLGSEKGEKLARPLKPPRPLDYVYRAPAEVVAKFLAPKGEGTVIELGKVWGYEMPAYVDADKLVSQHCAILASTGAGKSWLAGVIIERLAAAADAPVVVFDPHGEYSAMQVPRSEEGKAVAEAVQIYVVGKVDVSAQDKAFEAKYGAPRRYVRVGVNPRALPLRVLERLLEASYGLTDAQRRVLEEGWQGATAYGDRQPLTDVEELIAEVLEHGRPAAPAGYAGEMALSSLAARLRALFKGSPVFLDKYGDTYAGEPVKLVDPQRILSSPGIYIFDMSGLDLADQRIFLAVALDGMYKAALRRANLPSLIVIEEAHNFVPTKEAAVSKPYVIKIAREGRKFGLGLCLISQRPTKLDPDALSQCMTQIFKRIINPVDLRYVAAVAEHLDDPYQLRSLDEETALVTGVSVPMPLLIKVGDRWTQHGGVSRGLAARGTAGFR
ncbi:MAG: ATP-binding protein, partial [Thermoproteus sp.]|nr:ATP-binding protein [Thermoproteus sp.]